SGEPWAGPPDREITSGDFGASIILSRPSKQTFPLAAPSPSLTALFACHTLPPRCSFRLNAFGPHPFQERTCLPSQLFRSRRPVSTFPSSPWPCLLILARRRTPKKSRRRLPKLPPLRSLRLNPRLLSVESSSSRP